MDINKAIFERRSIRRYTNEPVSDEHIDVMLQAAMAAPSARNQQPWHFVVVKDRDKLNHSSKINPYASMAAAAPLGILVCADQTIEESEGYWSVDCAAAIQNILLTAHGLGLGAVWTAVYPRPERVSGFRSLYDLPDFIVPVALLVIGHPGEEVSTANRYKPERIHHNGW